MILAAAAVVVLMLAALGLVLLYLDGRQRRENARQREEMAAEFKAIQEKQERLDKSESMQMLNQSVLGLRQNLDSKIKEVNDRLGTAADTFTRVQHGLGRLDKLGESVEGLQSLLGSQKLRGGLGEQVMVDVLKDFVPASCRDTQVTLSSGVRVDAVVKTSEGSIPIDAKFPLENFIKASEAGSEAERAAALNELHKNARKHVRDIASKYICPGETVDFAVMYVPSDSVFAAMQEDPAICADAAQKRVFIVSPATFCALLSLVMLNLEGERLADEARSVMGALRGVQQLSGKFEDQLRVASTHVRNAGNAMELTGQKWQKLRSSIDSAAEIEGPGSEPSPVLPEPASADLGEPVELDELGDSKHRRLKVA